MNTTTQALRKMTEFRATQPGSARFASFDLYFDGNTATVHHMMTSRYYGTVDIATKTITTAYKKALEPLKTILYFFYDGVVAYTHLEEEDKSNYFVREL